MQQRQSMVLSHGVVAWSKINQSYDDDSYTRISLRVSGEDCDVISLLHNITFIRSTILISVEVIGEDGVDLRAWAVRVAINFFRRSRHYRNVSIFLKENLGFRARVVRAVTIFFRKNRHYRHSLFFLRSGGQFTRVIPEQMEGEAEDPKTCIPSYILVSDR